jgi:hypothetical protein
LAAKTAAITAVNPQVQRLSERAIEVTLHQIFALLPGRVVST